MSPSTVKSMRSLAATKVATWPVKASIAIFPSCSAARPACSLMVSSSTGMPASPRTCRIARRVAVVDSESLKRAVAELVMADVELSPFTGNHDFVVGVLDRAVNLGDP